MKKQPLFDRRAATRFAEVALILFVTFGGMRSLPVTASPSCEVDPARAKVYRLELTVPASYCRGIDKDPACEVFPKPSLIQLHGLWPNYRSGHPEGRCPETECREQSPEAGRYCAFPAPPGLYGAPWWPELKSYMAGVEKCLERHEWVKHGTCSSMSAPDYFRWSLEATRRIAGALNGLADRTVSRHSFTEQVHRELPDLADSLRLSCKRGSLVSLYVLYEWGSKPRRPIPTRQGRIHFGNCRDSFDIPSHPVRP